MRDDIPESPAAACPPYRGLSRAAGRIVGGGIGLLSLVLFVAATARMAVVSFGQLLEPYDLVYESPNLRTVEMLAAGRPIYAAEVYDAIPFVFTMYPPLYHAVLAALPTASTNPYFTGRLVGCIAMLGAAGTLALVGGRAGLPSALLCIACLWLFHPFTHLTAFLKPDGLGLFLSAAAVLVAAKWTGRGAAVASAVIATLAIWAKHSCLAAALACLCVFWIRGGVARWWFVAAASLLALLSWILAATAWGGGLIWCLRAGVSLPVFREQAVAVWLAAARQPLFLALLAAAHAAVVLSIWRTGAGGWHTPYPWYLLWADAVMAVGLGKPGSVNDPYLYGTLYVVGRPGPNSLIRCIETAAFDAVLLPPEHDPLRKRSSPALTAVYEAVHRTYAPHSLAPGLAVWIPRAGLGRHNAPGTDAAKTSVAGSRDGVDEAERFGAERP